MLANRSMHHIYPKKKAQGRVNISDTSGRKRYLERYRNPEKTEGPISWVAIHLLLPLPNFLDLCQL